MNALSHLRSVESKGGAENLAPTTAGGHGIWLPELDGFRAIAALSVVIAHRVTLKSLHFWAPVFCTGVANLAVLCFYVLSAFLLTYLAMRAGDDFSVIKFYRRRAARIWPLYFASIAIALLMYHPPETIYWCWKNSWIFLSFLLNWSLAINSLWGYEPLLPPGTPVLWSICVEEQFYALFPLAFIWCRNHRGRQDIIINLVFAIAVTFRILVLFLATSPGVYGIYYATPSYLDVFLPGCIAGYWWASGYRPAFLKYWLAGPACLALLYIANFEWNPRLWPPYGGGTLLDSVVAVSIYPVIGWLFAFLLLWSLEHRRSLFSRLCRSPFLRVIGCFSFGLYIWHSQVQLMTISFVDKYMGGQAPYCWQNSVLIMMFHLAICVAVAGVSYWVVERPFIRLTQRSSSTKRNEGQEPLTAWMIVTPCASILLAVALGIFAKMRAP